MNLLIGAVTIGLILAPLALGVFISYRLFRTLDLTTDGSFGVGAAVVAALLVRHVHPVAATALAAAAGVVTGAITGMLQTQFMVSALLAGILTTTAFYSVSLFAMGGGDLSLASIRSITDLAGQLGTEYLALPSSFTLLGTVVQLSSITSLILVSLMVGVLALGLSRYLGTELGLAMRAAGNNPLMARALGVDVDRMVVLGLGISNGLTALSGALLAQYEGFASIQMGVGAVVTGVAALLLGETLTGKHPLGRWITGVVLGAVAYRLLVAAAVRAGLHPSALKLVTTLIVLGVLLFPWLLRHGRQWLRVRAAAHHA